MRSGVYFTIKSSKREYLHINVHAFVATAKPFSIFMDATGDEDLKLRRASADLIAELQRSLPHFLFKTIPAKSEHSPVVYGGVRGLVRETKTDQLTKLVGSSYDQR